jgi:hypothetical protein
MHHLKRNPPTRLLLPTLLLITASGGCQSPYYADRGAGLGAVSGALAGAAIGEHNGNALAGAVLGAAGGGLAGAAIGDVMDAEVARNQAIIEQRMGRRMAAAVSMHDVIAMSQAGLSDDIIIGHMRAYGVAQPPQVNELIMLRNANVSESVIRAMQQPQVVVQPATYRPAPVIVEEYYYAPPPPWYFHDHHPRFCGPRAGWGFSYHHH